MFPEEIQTNFFFLLLSICFNCGSIIIVVVDNVSWIDTTKCALFYWTIFNSDEPHWQNGLWSIHKIEYAIIKAHSNYSSYLEHKCLRIWYWFCIEIVIRTICFFLSFRLWQKAIDTKMKISIQMHSLRSLTWLYML